MYNLIIPCAGNSTRFPNMRPKWMLTHPDGKLMIEKAIEGLNSNTFDRIIITILREHVEKYESELWLKQIFEDQVEVCIVEDSTFSEAETVYKTLLQMKVKGPFCVKDSDGYIAVIIKGENFVTGKDIRSMPELTNVPAKSFVLKNEQNILTDIIEKSVSSNHISIGLYGFGDVGQYIDKYLELSNIISTEEIYLSHIISSFIRGGAIFKYLEAEEYQDWGTVKEWRNDALKMSSYLVDIDGVVFRNKATYGNSAARVQQFGNSPCDLAPYILKIHIYSIRAGIFKIFLKVPSFIVHTGIKSKLISNIRAFLLSASNTYDSAPENFCHLTNNRSHCSRSGRNNDCFSLFGFTQPS